MIRILIVDDSPTILLLLRAIFGAQPDMQVVGEATSGEEAIRLNRTLRPSVITMDIRMPGTDGIEATRRIMQEQPAPIVVVSAAVDDPQAQIGFRALEVGAVAVLQKPPSPANAKYDGVMRDLVDTVRAMASIHVFRRRRSDQDQPPSTDFGDTLPAPTNFGDTLPMGFGATLPMPFASPPAAPLSPLSPLALPPRRELLAIAASTGGPQALLQVLSALPPDFPLPIVIVQHISEGFVTGMAEWLDGRIRLDCRVAGQGELLEPGRVYLAPDGRHLNIHRTSGTLIAHLAFGEPVERHLPSATPLFQSVAKTCGRRAIGLVMTGMGRDGGEGLLALRRAGGLTLAQGPHGCVAPSMPQTAIDLGAVDETLPLHRIAPRLSALIAAQQDDNKQPTWRTSS